MYSNSKKNEIKGYEDLLKLLLNNSISQGEVLQNLGLYIPRQSLTRILTFYELYKKIIEVPGYIFEFGVKYGQNLALFENFRGILEPYNYNRKIIGFDTFEGFPSVNKKDGDDKVIVEGHNNISSNHPRDLKAILDIHKSFNPIEQIQTVNFIKGDVTKTLPSFLKQNNEVVASLIFLDFDLYEPSKFVLEHLKKRITNNTIIAFDELINRRFPGVTNALLETFDLNFINLRRLNLDPNITYFQLGGR